ncbi:hypothetical protein GCM10017714_19340 [Curtobacterium pusillum]|jgi:hypothetical protein|uniref:Uncharacterized protein n=1 Tax=Curtobacterium pusillum TaxID=69373 RepID=A0AAW3TBN7_9MICO|nr:MULTISPECIES: hypothetical protein [Curtobacterium]MBA8992089.1 hypothetical protein [Curtobacterium pusillum]NUU13502.1 hypothetical protein [Curtobacterium pusillum]GLK32301.1 hypothetical protein GCM10017610_25860 [Curtobacterium pusillum]
MSVQVVVMVARIGDSQENAVPLTCVDRDVDTAAAAVSRQLPPGWQVLPSATGSSAQQRERDARIAALTHAAAVGVMAAALDIPGAPPWHRAGSDGDGDCAYSTEQLASTSR